MSERLIYPDGFKPGCNIRTFRPGTVCGLFSEKIPVIPVAEWGDLIGEVELRSCVTKIKDQNGYGSCATESTAQSDEIVRKLEGQEWVELNPLSIYHTTSHGRDQGSSIDENLAFARDYGICPESVWPRSKGWQVAPSAEAMEAAAAFKIGEFYDIGSTAEAGTALLLGFAVVMGWQGHSVVLTELLSPTIAAYANSWGADWGDEGFGTIKLSSINFGYGMFAQRTAVINAKVGGV
jgi:hypothetical protein